MTFEEFIKLAHTPLPGPPMLTEEQMARLKASLVSMGRGAAGFVPEMSLPMMPEWMRRYSEERGLLPEVDGPGRSLPRGPGTP